MAKNVFRVGDTIAGKDGNGRGITNGNMLEAKILKTEGITDTMYIRIIKYTYNTRAKNSPIGKELWVPNDDQMYTLVDMEYED